MDADKHIASLNRVYFLLAIVTATLIILFYQQYERSSNALTVRRLDLSLETYSSLPPPDQLIPAKSLELYETIYGKDFTSILVISWLDLWLQNINYYTTEMELKLFISRIINRIYHLLRPTVTKDITYADLFLQQTHDVINTTYYIPNITYPFYFGGHCNALAIRGPASEHALSLPGGELPLSKFFAIIYAYGCIDNKYRIALATTTTPDGRWKLFLPEDAYDEVMPDNRYGLGIEIGTPIYVDMSKFLYSIDLLPRGEYFTGLKEAASKFWTSPKGTIIYVPVSDQDIQHALVFFARRSTGLQRGWDDYQSAVNDVIDAQLVSASIGSVGLDLGYWLAVTPLIITGCVLLLQRRIAILAQARRKGQLLISGPWLIKETTSLLDKFMLMFWAMFPLGAIVTWGILYTYYTRLSLNIFGQSIDIWPGIVFMQTPDFPSNFQPAFADFLLLMRVFGMYLGIRFVIDTYALWRLR